MSILRFFCHYAADPCFNMAFDETMLGEVTRNPEMILLRLYTWAPGAITIGANQQAAKAVRMDKLGDTPLLRRITGGRAVYHDESELTYAIALNLDNPDLTGWHTSVNAVYLQLAEALRLFLARLGRSAQIVRRSSGRRVEPVNHVIAPCFESAARYELTVDGIKILASAQRQAGPAILQHGSIKLKGLVGHPALRSGSRQPHTVRQPIEQERFEWFSTQFVETLGEWFQVDPDHRRTGEATLPGLVERRTMICADPLGKRNPLER